MDKCRWRWVGFGDGVTVSAAIAGVVGSGYGSVPSVFVFFVSADDSLDSLSLFPSRKRPVEYRDAYVLVGAGAPYAHVATESVPLTVKVCPG